MMETPPLAAGTTPAPPGRAGGPAFFCSGFYHKRPRLVCCCCPVCVCMCVCVAWPAQATTARAPSYIKAFAFCLDLPKASPPPRCWRHHKGQRKKMADHMSSLVLGGVGRVVRASDPTAAPPFTAPSPPKKDPERALPLFSNPSPYFKEGCLTTALFVAVCFLPARLFFPTRMPRQQPS